MRITATDRISNIKYQISNLHTKIKIFGFWSVILIFGFCSLILVAGCVQKSGLKQAQGDAKQANAYYQRAVREYQELIKQGKDLDRLHFELGYLYFSRGKFEQAIAEFKKAKVGLAGKFQAISYYRLGNFTDALEIFNKRESRDGEYLYYYALTCEKLNLYDSALKIYRKIDKGDFAALALKRVELIEKKAAALSIKDQDPKISEILANAPPDEQYPQAGALILLCDETSEVTPDSREISDLHYLIKILNERGKEAFSETEIQYDSTYEKVELEYARTIRPDGAVIEVGSRHIRDVSKYLNFPLYSNARVLIISFPEITEGAAIEYKLRIYRSQLVDKKNFVINYPLQSSEPIISANFSLKIPKDKILHMKTLNSGFNDFGASLKPEVKEKNGQLLYAWHFKDIPQIIPEPNMPPGVEINPTLLISTFNSWQEIYGWWWSLAKDKIKADAAIKEKVAGLTKKLNSEEAKIRAIYNFCAKEIRYVAVEYGEAGYEPHQAEDIFKNKYGDCKDQAILLVTMLKEAGLTAWPVIIPTKEYYNLNADFPALFFNHVIAALPLEGKLIFLDPTAETCSFGDLPGGDQARRALVIKEDNFSIQETPLYPSGHNLVRQDLKIKIHPDESIEAEKSISSFGLYDQAQRYWLLYTQPELIEQALKEKIQDTSVGAKLKDYNIKNLNDLNTPVILSYSFDGPEFFTFAGILRIIPQMAGLDTSLVAKDKRKYAIDFGVLDSKETIFEIEIPDNFVIKYIPPDVIKESPWINFSAAYNRQDNKIKFVQKVESGKSLVTIAEYPEFKNFFEGLAKEIKQKIILEKKK